MEKKKTRKKNPPKDMMTTYERREEILRLIIKAGHPRAISQVELAKHYKVSQVMIHKDIVAIATQIKKELPKDAEFITQVVFQSAIKSLVKGNNADKFKAAKLVKDWNDWLFDMGKQDKAAQKIDTTGLFGGVNINIVQPDNDNNKLETNKKTIPRLRNSKRQKNN